MLFGIDFDNTFSADPALFHSFLDLLTARGHKAVIVTGRSKPTGKGGLSEFLVEVVTKGRLPIVYAGMKFKRLAATEAGYNVDIWIDDNPEFIDKQDPEKLQYKTAIIIAKSSNGKTRVFETCNLGSNPSVAVDNAEWCNSNTDGFEPFVLGAEPSSAISMRM